MIKIPGYTIVKELGRGGMATVYLAIQESFQRQVAIKVMSEQLSQDPDFSDRFQREARIVSRMNHPHIVTVHDVGVVNNHHYLAMQFIDGRPLNEKFLELTLAQKVRVLREIASALHYAGSKGYVHRDVKPENIMISDEDGRAMLMDFGIAKAADGSHSMTKTGIAIGTPYYMSPEQARGDAVDQRSDIYSLGAMMYHLLTGVVPYEADSGVAIVLKHITQPVPLLPAHLALLQPILDKAMAKDPQLRYQSGKELMEDLERLDLSALGKTGNASLPVAGATDKTIAMPSAQMPLNTGASVRKKTIVMAILLLSAVSGGLALVMNRESKPDLAVIPEAAVEIKAMPPVPVMPADPAPVVAKPEKPNVVKLEAEEVKTQSLKAEAPQPVAATSATTTPQWQEPDMVLIPAGSFQMGIDHGEAREKPAHTVTVAAFYLATTEVTKSQFAAFIQETAYRTDADNNAGGTKACYAYKGGSDFGWQAGTGWNYPGFKQADNEPVVCVSANDVVAYIRWLNSKTGKKYRLPSEAEWEYAARAGSTNSPWHFGSNEAGLCVYANVIDRESAKVFQESKFADCADGATFTAAVGSYQPNGFGLYDMHGNVWEWTADCWNENYEGAPLDGSAWRSGDCEKQVLRGGSWIYNPRQLRVTYRNGGKMVFRGSSHGFRLARDR